MDGRTKKKRVKCCLLEQATPVATFVWCMAFYSEWNKQSLATNKRQFQLKH